MRVAIAALAAAFALHSLGCSPRPAREDSRVADRGSRELAIRAPDEKSRGHGRVLTSESLIDAVVGGEIARSLQRSDELRADEALEANRTGQAATWVNPDSGLRVTVVPTRTVQLGTGEFCREYEAAVDSGGTSERGYGKACRQPDGSWKPVPRM